MTANNLKNENTKLRTRLHMFEVELQRKDRIIDEMVAAQEANFALPNAKRAAPASKGEQAHLVINLKRKIKEMLSQQNLLQDEIERHKRNIKVTRLAEIEAEIKVYMQECARLRIQLEEVIKSKDTFADPQELKMIEEKFKQRDALILQLQADNTQLSLGL